MQNAINWIRFSNHGLPSDLTGLSHPSNVTLDFLPSSEVTHTRLDYTDLRAILVGLVLFATGTLFAVLGHTSLSQGVTYPCLSAETSLREPVRTEARNGRSETVAQRLKSLRARCIGGKLVDKRGREIRIFRGSCWGNPPEDYLNVLAEERRTLASLKRKYTVIALQCDVRSVSSNVRFETLPLVS